MEPARRAQPRGRGQRRGGGVWWAAADERLGQRLGGERHLDLPASDAETLETQRTRRDPHPDRGLALVELDRGEGFRPQFSELVAQPDPGEFLRQFALDPANQPGQLRVGAIGEADALAQKVDARRIGQS